VGVDIEEVSPRHPEGALCSLSVRDRSTLFADRESIRAWRFVWSEDAMRQASKAGGHLFDIDAHLDPGRARDAGADEAPLVGQGAVVRDAGRRPVERRAGGARERP